MVNYVKFIRCTQTYFNNFSTKDKDTLYFVYKKDAADIGLLYLGNVLISGNLETEQPEVEGYISINEVKEIIIDQHLTDGDILLYNEVTKKWENHTLRDLLEYAAFKGATETEDGLIGLVPVPQAGDQLKFLSGSGTWEEIDTYDDELHEVTALLVGDDTGMSVRDIAEDVAVEIWDKIGDLQAILNGADGDSDLGLRTRVQQLEDTMGDFVPVPQQYLTVGSAIDYFNESITEINDRLRWHGMVNE